MRKSSSINKIWTDHEKLVCQWAWKYQKAHPALSFDDLLAEGKIAFCEAFEAWDPSRGAFSTALVWRLRGRMSEWVRRESLYARPLRSFEEEFSNEKGEIREPAAPERFIERLMREVSDEAKKLINIALEEKKLPSLRRDRKARLAFAEVKEILAIL